MLTGILPTMAHDDLVTVGRFLQFGGNCPLRIQERIETGLVIILDNNFICLPFLFWFLILVGNILVERWLAHETVSTFCKRAKS